MREIRTVWVFSYSSSLPGSCKEEQLPEKQCMVSLYSLRAIDVSCCLSELDKVSAPPTFARGVSVTCLPFRGNRRMMKFPPRIMGCVSASPQPCLSLWTLQNSQAVRVQCSTFTWYFGLLSGCLTHLPTGKPCTSLVGFLGEIVFAKRAVACHEIALQWHSFSAAVCLCWLSGCSWAKNMAH